MELLATWLTDAFPWPLWASASCLGLLLCLLSLHTADKLFAAKRSRQRFGAATTRPDDEAFARFQQQYLAVYALIMLADWLQGTHMYSLYQVRSEVSASFIVCCWY
jgi:hypothetical protein